MNNMDLLADALAYMENHLDKEIKTEDVADACYCSKSTLEKLFRCVNDITIHDYLVRRRMMKAAKLLVEQPETGILEIALGYGYSTNESFTRAFKQVWNCNPSEFRRSARFSELFPKIEKPLENGDTYMKERRHVDISELYDLFVTRNDCYFVCCDIKDLVGINNISRKAGDLAILESMNRMINASGDEDVVFRIGGDEFAILTNSTDISYAQKVVAKIKSYDGQPIIFEEKELPLGLHIGITQFKQTPLRYNELFTELHMSIKESK